MTDHGPYQPRPPRIRRAIRDAARTPAAAPLAGRRFLAVPDADTSRRRSAVKCFTAGIPVRDVPPRSDGSRRIACRSAGQRHAAHARQQTRQKHSPGAKAGAAWDGARLLTLRVPTRFTREVGRQIAGHPCGLTRRNVRDPDRQEPSCVVGTTRKTFPSMQTARRSTPPNGRSRNAWRRFVDSATNRRDNGAA